MYGKAKGVPDGWSVHEHDGLFGIIDMYGEGLAFFKDGDAYPYASGFSDAAEAMGFRIAWNREQDKSLQIESRHL